MTDSAALNDALNAAKQELAELERQTEEKKLQIRRIAKELREGRKPA